MTYKPKTLLVEFAPGGDRSITRNLRKYFTDLIEDNTEIEYLDLAKETPDLFNAENLPIYYKRNYLHEPLTPEEAAKLVRMDLMRDQLLRNDILILASPMYNFGYPAPVKAWIDSVMQKDYVYTIDENGHVPKLQYLKACFIFTSGIIYDQVSNNESENGILAEGPKLFEYMGVEKARVIHLMGTDQLPQKNLDFRKDKVALPKLRDLAKHWYDVDVDNKLKLLGNV